QFFRIHPSQKFLEGGARRGQRGGVLRLEFAKVVANRLDRSGTRRCGGEQADQRLVDSFGKVQRRFGGVRRRGGGSEFIGALIAALIQIHQTLNRFAQQKASGLQSATTSVRAY